MHKGLFADSLGTRAEHAYFHNCGYAGKEVKARDLEAERVSVCGSQFIKVPRLPTGLATEVACVNDFLCEARLLKYAHFHLNPVGW